MGPLLRSAIDDVYRAFEGYPRPTWFYGCGCCWQGEPVADDGPWGRRGVVRVSAPGGASELRELAPEELAEFAFEVPLTAGDTALYKHYLPRILEIAITNGFGWPDVEVVFSRLDWSDRGSPPWTEWPENEQGALRGLFHALWIDCLAAPDDDDRVDDTLCAIGLVESEIGWYLQTWLEFSSPHAVDRLLGFLQRNSHDLASGKLRNSFWADREPAPSNVTTIVDWLRSEATRDTIAAAADRARSLRERDALEEIYLRWLP